MSYYKKELKVQSSYWKKEIKTYFLIQLVMRRWTSCLSSNSSIAPK